MKKITLAFCFLVGFVITISAQEKFKRVFDEKSQTDILVGNCERADLLSCAFVNEYNEEYPAYRPDDGFVGLLKENMDNLHEIKCTIVLGTWCGDSKEQVPRFLKLLDMLGNPFMEIRMIAVNRDKEVPEQNIKEQYKIEKVPTFIFYRGDTEIGRIVETPKESLEKDLLGIVKVN